MDCKKGEISNPNPKSTKGNSYFNRSLTISGGGGGGAAAAQNRRELNRMGSVKNLHHSPPPSSFDSIVSLKGKVKKLCSLFEYQKSSRSNSNSVSLPPPSTAKTLAGKSPVLDSPAEPQIQLPGTEDRVVIYFTSLRGIRRTFEDCYTVRMIIKGFRVNVDERDISMDSAYKKELQSVLGEKIVSLPQVFIKGKYIGGAEVIKQMNEVGELVRLLRGLPIRPPGYVCEGCGDARFIPCSNCNGSRKVFDEDEGQLRRCLECNENGLVRCPLCCS